MSDGTKKGSLCFAVLTAVCVCCVAQAVDVVAVYYPHWHQYPKGDEWFGPSWKEGEWEFVKTAKVRFPGHRVPLRPLVGYLNGKDPADVETEIALASNAGIDVFLYDYYYYNGEITQEEALEQGFLKAKNRDRMKFALMWCFHDRRFAWRVPIFSERRNVMSLARTPEEFLGLIDLAINRYFGRKEYWRPNGKVFLSIFGANNFVKSLGLEAAKAAIAEARRRIRTAGLGELDLNGQGGSVKDGELMVAAGFDSLTHYTAIPIENEAKRYAAGERLFDYADTTLQLQKRYADYAKLSVPYYPSVSAGWDATLRCRNDEPFPWKGPKQDYPYCVTFTNATPEHFERNLRQAKDFAENDAKHPNVVYINSWNEYTEGSYLLPTVRDSDQMLRAIARVFGRRPADTYVFGEKRKNNPKAPNGRAMSIAMPTFENVKYGPHLRQGMDVWLPNHQPLTTNHQPPTPLLVFIHGGGWVNGDRMNAGIIQHLQECRARGVAFATVSYRMLGDGRLEGLNPPVQAPLADAVAAIRFIQAHAKEWNIDPTRIGLTGGSAGACSSLYASLQGDCELGVKAVLAMRPQTSLDPEEMKAWIPNISYGASAFGYRKFNEWLAHRADCLEWIERFSPVALLRRCTPSKAPVFLYGAITLPKPGQLPKDPTHAGMFCVKFKEACDAKGVSCREGTLGDLLSLLCD